MLEQDEIGTAAIDTSCGAPCCGKNIDASGLRIGGTCAVYGEPSFGMLSINWIEQALNMQILKADGSGVAVTRSVDGVNAPVSMEFEIDLRFCLNKMR